MSLFFQEQRRGITWDDYFGAGGASRSKAAGDNALRVIPVYAAVSLIANAISTLPVQQYRGKGAQRQQVDLVDFIEEPAPGLTRVDWLHQLMVSLLLRGNAYGHVVQEAARTTSCRWIEPDKVTVDELGTYPTYRWGGGPEQLDVSLGGKILHARSFTTPGKWKAQSPIGLFASNFDMWMAATLYGKEWFEGSGIPTGILKNTLSTLDPRQADTARQRFVDAVRKPGPVTLDKNWDWTKVSVSPEEAQFLNTIKATATQIAAIFGVDPADIGGEAGTGLRYSNREQDEQRLDTRTLLPWTVRVERVLSTLLPPGEFIKFNMDGRSRPDLLTRTKANNEALKGGQLTLEEVRAHEDRRMLTPAEILFWQENYQTMKSESESTSDATSTSIVKE